MENWLLVHCNDVNSFSACPKAIRHSFSFLFLIKSPPNSRKASAKVLFTIKENIEFRSKTTSEFRIRHVEFDIPFPFFPIDAIVELRSVMPNTCKHSRSKALTSWCL